MEKRIFLVFFLLFLFLLLFQSTRISPPVREEKKEGEKVPTFTLPSLPPPVSTLETDWGKIRIISWGGISSCLLSTYRERDYGKKNLLTEIKRLKSVLPRARGEERKKIAYQIFKLEKAYEYFTRHHDKEVEIISLPQRFHLRLPPYLTYMDSRRKLLFQEGAESSYQVVQKENKLLLKREEGDMIIWKEFIPSSKNYLFKVRIILESKGDSLPPGVIRVSVGPGVGYPEGGRYYGYQGPVGWVEGKLARISFPRREKGTRSEVVRYGKVDWVAVQNPYFTQTLVSRTPAEIAWFSRNEFGENEAGIEWEYMSPGKKREVEFLLYLGPKKINALQDVHPTLPSLVDFGYFGNLFRIIYVLNFFYRLTHNYGWSIIILTFLINLVLFPLSWKSFHSMKMMQKLQPQIEALRKKYRDDPQKLNRELMELYRKEGINPMGGCLPLFFQMPVFFALFTTLRSAIELRGAPFIGWINDLSLPDTLLTLGGFPVHILPLLMGAATFFQQRLTTARDSRNPLLSSFMPLFLTFIFYNFPSGLVLYWLVNSILNVLEQICVLKLTSS